MPQQTTEICDWQNVLAELDAADQDQLVTIFKDKIAGPSIAELINSAINWLDDDDQEALQLYVHCGAQPVEIDGIYGGYTYDSAIDQLADRLGITERSTAKRLLSHYRTYRQVREAGK